MSLSSVTLYKVLQTKFWMPMVIQCRGSRYPVYYSEPTFKPDDVDKLYEDGLATEKQFIPVKAAKSDEHSSVFRDDLVNKFINLVMEMGKKHLARKLVEKAFENVKSIQIEKYHKAPEEEKSQIECDPVKIFYQAIANSKPLLALTPIKRGAIVYQVPIPISESRKRFLAMKWLIDATNDKDRKIHFPEKLAWELLDAFKNEGRVIKKKQELHKQCEANKAFAHYRWGR